MLQKYQSTGQKFESAWFMVGLWYDGKWKCLKFVGWTRTWDVLELNSYNHRICDSNVLNKNMGCIGTDFIRCNIVSLIMLNKNMGCIGTALLLLLTTFVSRVEQEHGMYWNHLGVFIIQIIRKLNKNMGCIGTT